MSQSDADVQESTECPTCGDGFDNAHGMRIHHSRVHGESIAYVDRECERCGESFKAKKSDVKRGGGRFCSSRCFGKDNFDGDTLRRECEACGEAFKACKTRVDNGEARYCSYECHHKQRRANKVSRECAVCGDAFKIKESQLEHRPGRYCSLECAGEAHQGEDHYNWKGGGVHYYGPNWEEQRNKARERDDHECQVCGSPEIHVHHIRPLRTFDTDEYKQANALKNLICLCPSHHKKWEGIPLRPQTD